MKISAGVDEVGRGSLAGPVIASSVILDHEILGLNDIGFHKEIIEDKKTIVENSIAKVRFVKERTGYDCFADDTGLEVNALNGKPGVFSKRFAGPNASSDDNINKLL